jgi:hypothetical protein
VLMSDGCRSSFEDNTFTRRMPRRFQGRTNAGAAVARGQLTLNT